ncbi:Nitrate/nitrite sensor protein NarX [Nonomuraea coxensis DSM 45129]|uniref:histidine kinase n=1 Tax=Nonomuraea coxensis DSM 45129 TaxID=1122611 RepID=A0ABX8TU55_9ACTN|nr:histidine kinase [Nonomuraea coxensis]QYC39010.1 Nitrate/nitrite sensor protein NarX [Nonomuraea coxensis DSM 45129]
MPETRGRWALPDTIAPGWLVVQVFGTLIVAATLLTAREGTPLVWVLYGTAAGCWLAFVALDPRRPAPAAAFLAAATLVSAAALGPAADSSAVILTCIFLARFAALAAPPVTVIMVTTGVAIVLAILGQDTLADASEQAVLLLAVALIGVNHRQHVVQARQAELLLEQTRRTLAVQARAAALHERTRIAREIHDVLAHSLGALGVQLELAQAVLEERRDVPGAIDTIARARRLAGEGLAEARNAVAALRQDVPTLSDALGGLARTHEDDHRSPVRFERSGPPRPLSSAATVSLLATAREALTNAAKHAPGAPVHLELAFTADRVRLRVANALTGGPPGTPGFGLTGMRERLALAGGALTCGREGERWLVTAEVRE